MAPPPPESLAQTESDFPAPPPATPTSGFSIDTTDRNATVAGYHAYFQSSEDFDGTDDFFTSGGDVAGLIPGTLSNDFQDKTLRRINYYRAQAGRPADIYFTAEKNAKAQKGALIMAYLNTITHYPAVDFPGNASVVNDQNNFGGDGIEAAEKSNLSLGRYGPASVDGQMTDDGSNNTIVGHRRWLLYSRAQEMGNGSTPANGTFPYTLPEHPYIGCVWVIGDWKAAPTAQATPWPNEGFIPWDLAPNDGESFPRWSYSYPGADFSSATVTMTQGGNNIPLVQEGVVPAPQDNFFVGDNTLVWRPSGIPDAAPASDTTYIVTITGIANAPFSSTNYEVTLVDPYKLNESSIVTGNTTPTVGVPTTYNFSAITSAEAYEARIWESATGTWTEGAEDSPTPQITDETEDSYSLVSNYAAATGSKSFHLATPHHESVATPNDSFVIDRTVIPQADSQVQFKYRRFHMHPDTKLRIQISDDDGANYTTIQTIDGQASVGQSIYWDSDFQMASVDVPANYIGSSVRVRFLIERAGLYYPGSSDTVGLYIDDITLTNSLELTNPSTIALTALDDSFDLTPSVADQDYKLQVRAQLGGHWFSYGDMLTVTSTDALPAPEITSSANATGSQGSPFSYQITATNSPTSYNATGLPAGASVNTNSGLITGTIAPGTYNGITISATNAGGSDATALTITIQTGYEAEVAQNYPALGGPTDDHDDDGVDNLIELAIDGMDPTSSDSHLLPTASLTGGQLTLTIPKSGLSGIDYEIVGTSDLSLGTHSTNNISIVVDNATTLTVTYPLSESDKHFIWLVVDQNDETTTEP